MRPDFLLSAIYEFKRHFPRSFGFLTFRMISELNSILCHEEGLRTVRLLNSASICRGGTRESHSQGQPPPADWPKTQHKNNKHRTDLEQMLEFHARSEGSHVQGPRAPSGPGRGLESPDCPPRLLANKSPCPTRAQNPTKSKNTKSKNQASALPKFLSPPTK